jgi:hypothetical protein
MVTDTVLSQEKGTHHHQGIECPDRVGLESMDRPRSHKKLVGAQLALPIRSS